MATAAAAKKAPAKKAAAKKDIPIKGRGDRSGLPEVLVKQIVMVPVGSLARYPKNPRVGNIEAIKESMVENGFFDALVVQKSTNYVIDGNHRWSAAVELGMAEVPAIFVDVDDKAAAKIVLAANRTNDLATYDSEILAEIMKGLDSPVGTGYTQDDMAALMDAIEYHDVGQIEDVIRPSLTIQAPTEEGGMPTASVKNPVIVDTMTPEEKQEQFVQDDEDHGELDTVDVQAQLQAVLAVSEDNIFTSNNYYGIPDLIHSALLDKLPDDFDTWAGHDATPDDGKTTWLWNYGVASRKNLPADRAVLGFYTYDAYFEGWWDNPAYYTSKVVTMGVNKAIVPDFSLWNMDPTVMHIWNVFRAQWLGRFFQEAGMKVIPRLQFNLGDGGRSLDFCMAGIPKNPPILAASCQHNNGREDFKNEVDYTVKCLTELMPGTFLVYGGNPGLRIMEAVEKEMRKVTKGIEFRHVYNYSHKRRGVVYDKKDGLAAKKEKKRAERDRFHEEPTPPTAASKTAGKVEDDDSEFDVD